MITDFGPSLLDSESAARFNELRVAPVASRMQLGDLSVGVEALLSFRPGDLVCVGILEGSTQRSVYSMTCIDLDGDPFNGVVSEPVRLINHACMPNLVMLPVPTPGLGYATQLAVAALAIEPGDELTFAYHQTEPAISGFERCLCSDKGVPCVQAIGGWNSLDEHWKGHYRDMFGDLGLAFPSHLR